MNIECPNCHAAYDVPDSRLGARRVVRCGTCGHAWPVGDAEVQADARASAAPNAASPGSSDPHHPARTDEPPAPQAPAVAAAGDRLAPLRPAPLHPAAPRDALLTGAWVASALLIIGIATAAYAWRGDVAVAWPPAARILGAPLRADVVAETLVPSTTRRQYMSTDATIPSPARRD